MLSDEEFRQLLDVLDRPWAGFRKVRKGVKKRVRRHMEMLGCNTLNDYLLQIENNPVLRNECEVCLEVTISRFYRDRRLFEYLANHILPELMYLTPSGLNAWSAGCANGEEPYTLAMVWEMQVISGKPPTPLQILATDANTGCLRRAVAGQYPLSSLRELPDDMKTRWFKKVPGKRLWRIDPLLGKHIEWLPHDLMEAPPGDAFHLILLRNSLLTYYQGSVMRRSFENIARSLVPGGVLILGSHELLPSGFPFTMDPIFPSIYHR